MKSSVMLITLIAAAQATTPSQVHLALAGTKGGYPSGMRVMWFTASLTSSIVEYGLNETRLTSNATGSAARNYLEGHGYHHAVALVGLTPGTTYYYRVGDGISAWSQKFSFRSAAARSDVEVSLSVFGDMGYLNSTARHMLIPLEAPNKAWTASHTYDRLRGLVDAGTINGVWHLGDIGYADDTFAYFKDVVSFGYEDTYNAYMEWLEPITSAVPYMVTVGNHESECHSPACLVREGKYAKPLSNFSAYNTRWSMPYAESHGTSNMWYSFNLGAAHLIALDTETDWDGAEEEGTGDSHIPWLRAGSFGREGEYLAWLEADLKAADAARKSAARTSGAADNRPWIIAGGHRPWEELRVSHGALFAKYGVDAYFAGHAHSYRRETTTLAADGTKEDDGGTPMLSVVVGGPGCDEMHADTGPPPDPSSRGMGQPSYATHRYASGVLRVNQTALVWQLLDSMDGSVLDEVRLSKSL